MSRKRTRSDDTSEDPLLNGLTINEDGTVMVDKHLLKRLKITDDDSNQQDSENSVSEKTEIENDGACIEDVFAECPEYASVLVKGLPVTEDLIAKAQKRRNINDRKMAEIVGNIPLDLLAIKRSTAQTQDFEYRYKPPVQPRVTNQYHSGRCWLFAGLNVLRYGFIFERHLKHDFEFSASYLYFWDKIERSNVFLQTMFELREKPLDDR